MAQISLIVGLGNPGNEYSDTRHNAGFWFIDELALLNKVCLRLEGKFFAEVGKFRHEGRDIYLLKPQTYMNLSGRAVQALIHFYKIPANEVMVVHDELDFEPGIAKIKQGGGNGGHNGLKDIEKVIGKDFLRLRLGIGHPGDRAKAADYVLKKPSKDEHFSIELAIIKAKNVINFILDDKINVAMKQLHT